MKHEGVTCAHVHVCMCAACSPHSPRGVHGRQVEEAGLISSCTGMLVLTAGRHVTLTAHTGLLARGRGMGAAGIDVLCGGAHSCGECMAWLFPVQPSKREA